jgi:WD40 repeat protein
MSGGAGTPCLFLSHSGADTAAAVDLKRRILASPATRKAGLRVWLDKDDIVPSAIHWQAQIEQAIETAATSFAVYAGSGGVLNWVENEVRLGLSRATGDKGFAFIPILSGEAPGSKALPAFAWQYQAVRDPLNDEGALAKLIAAAIDPRSLSPKPVVLVDRPFVGLQTMTEDDADLFFGRDKEINQLIDIFARRNLAAIVADSGSGKSSLALAGFVPAFRGGRVPASESHAPDARIRHIVVMRPGNDPLEGMRLGVTRAAEEIGRSDEQRSFYRSKIDFANPGETAYQLQCGLPAEKTLTLLVVDQFEEALVGQHEDQNRPFGAFLAALAGRPDFRVLLTVRQDYFNLTQRFEALYEKLVADDQVSILRLKRITDEGLGEIIRRPLAMAGYPDTPEVDALVSAVTRDMSDRPGDLTLVQSTLDAVWRNRESAGGLMAAYTKVGGVAGALASEAETTRRILTAQEQKRLPGVFVRLIRPGDTAGATRRIARLTEFSDANRTLVQKLAGPKTEGQERLAPLLFVGDHVEIAHEALITQWGWLQENLQTVWPDLRRLDRLIDKAEAWSAAFDARKKDHLATGVEREDQTKLAGSHPDWLSDSERIFVAESQKAFNRQKTIARMVVGTLAAFSLSLAVNGAFLVISRSQLSESNTALSDRNNQLSERNNQLAETSAGLERAQVKLQERNDSLADANAHLKSAVHSANTNLVAALTSLAESKLEESPATATKLALAAWPRKVGQDGPRFAKTITVLSRAVQQLDERRVYKGHDGSVDSAAFSPDGRYIVTASGGDRTARLWNVDTGKEIRVFRGHDDGIISAAFSSDGRRVVTASMDKTARLWDVDTGTEIRVFRGHSSHVSTATVSPDGSRLVTASWDGTVRLWNVDTGTEIRAFRHSDRVFSAAFSIDGRHIVTASADGTARLWDVNTGTETRAFNGHSGLVFCAAFSPDGRRLVTASLDNTARLWDVGTGTELRTLKGHDGRVYSAAFSPDGRRVVTASSDRTARLWDVETGTEIHAFKGHEGWLYSAAVSPDGRRIVTASEDKTARLWDVETSTEIRAFKGHKGPIIRVAFSTNGRYLFTASDDHTTRLWDVETGTELRASTGRDNWILNDAFSPDRRRFVTASRDNTARMWDVETRTELRAFKGHSDSVNRAAFSPDGRRIVTASSDQTARLWDVETGTELRAFKGHSKPVSSVAFSLDGRRIVTASYDNTARVWDVETGTEIRVFKGHDGWLYSASFSPDGQRIVTASHDQTARLWDVDTGTAIRALRGHDSEVFSAAFSPDGRRVATASSDGTARLWDVASIPPGNLFAIACAWLPDRSLENLASEYGFKITEPICQGDPPTQPDPSLSP